MLTIEEIRQNQGIMHCLDVEMTSEKAISLYLEWGAFSAHGQGFVRSGEDSSCFFSVDAWKMPAKLLLVRQTSSGREVIGEVNVPQRLVDKLVDSWGGRKGTYNVEGELLAWLREQL